MDDVLAHDDDCPARHGDVPYGHVVDRAAANDSDLPEIAGSLPSRTTWFDRLREAIGVRISGSNDDTKERLIAMRNMPLNADDLRDIHFAAVE